MSVSRFSLTRGRAIGIAVMIPVLFVMGFLIQECSEMPGSPELQVGQRIMYQMAGRENLEQVDFFEAYREARPSDFVEMIASPDHALWPPRPDDLRPGYSSGNRVLMPEGLVFSPRERRTRDTDEIVYRGDDANDEIVVIGYRAGEDEPAFEYRWEFPTDATAVRLDGWR